MNPEIQKVIDGESEGVILCGDCLDVMKDMPDGCVDAIITDPPYGTENLGGGYGRRQNHDPQGRHGRRIKGDTDLSIFEGIVSLSHILTIDSWFMAFCAPRRRHEVTKILVTGGFEPFGELVWDKGRPGLGYTIRYSHETMLVCYKGKPKASKIALSIIRIPAHGTPEHPHEKPVAFMEHAVLFASEFGSIIFDPCCGLAATCVAAKKLGRRYIGIEISEEYCQIARDRLKSLDTGVPVKEMRAGQIPLFE